MENAPYKIDNLSDRVNASYFQVGCKNIAQFEECPPSSNRPFAWRTVLNSSFLLNIQFYIRNGADSDILIPKRA